MRSGNVFGGDGSVMRLVQNRGRSPLYLASGEVLGTLEPGEIVPTQGGKEERRKQLCAEVQMDVHNLTLEQRDKLMALVTDYADVFAMEGEPLGSTQLVEHHIDTGSHPPIRQYARRVPHTLRAQALYDLTRKDTPFQWWLFPDQTIENTNALASAGGENQVSTCEMAADDQADAPEWSHTCSFIGTGSLSCNPDHTGTGDSSCSPDTIIGTGVYSCSPLIHNTGTGARADAHQRGHTCNPNTNTHVTGTSDYTVALVMLF